MITISFAFEPWIEFKVSSLVFIAVDEYVTKRNIDSNKISITKLFT